MEGLVSRILSGLGSNKYHAVDYDELQSQVLERRLAANGSLIHMKRLQHKNLLKKEDQTTRMHQLAWNKELLKLKDLRHNLEIELAQTISQRVQEGSKVPFIFKEMETLTNDHNKDRQIFKVNTVQPIWNLYEDLKIWLYHHHNLKNAKTTFNQPKLGKSREVKDTIFSVKEQQQTILFNLQTEQKKLETELYVTCRDAIESSVSCDSVQKPVPGIPLEAVNLECPDDNLKDRVLREFFFIDEKNNDKLQSLKENHKDILSQGEYGGWSAEDHQEFLSILEQYDSEDPKKSWLVLDRLLRQMMHISKKELMQHQEWWQGWRFYREHRNNVFRDWHRMRNELFHKTCIIFTEACLTYELDENQMKTKLAQKELCDQLYEKVTSWRERKYEQLVLEAKLLEKTSQARARKEKEKEEKMKQMRDKTKHDIKTYKEQKMADQQREEERCRRRLAEIQEELDLQNSRNLKRIKYREKEWLKKIDELQEKKLQKETEEFERLLRLEALRQKVQVFAERDPVRLLNETKSWQAKTSRNKENYEDIQKPLFQTYGFTSEQVTSNPRFRLEEKLRDAGLLASDYARKALMNMQPLQPPRPDMLSTLKLGED